jgi:hypothetical protein
VTCAVAVDELSKSSMGTVKRPLLSALSEPLRDLVSTMVDATILRATLDTMKTVDQPRLTFIERECRASFDTVPFGSFVCDEERAGPIVSTGAGSCRCGKTVAL